MAITEAEIEAGIAVASQIIDIIVKVAPKIEQGIVSAQPYAEAIAGMITGKNATIDTINAMQAQLESDSADFQTPLPPDDGSTTT
jgi:hypothetical protein